MEPKVQRVDLSPNDDRVYEEFPDDPGLAGFDRDDRVYVAIALASGGACFIQNATDRDWWTYKDALEIASVEIDFICPELMHE